MLAWRNFYQTRCHGGKVTGLAYYTTFGSIVGEMGKVHRLLGNKGKEMRKWKEGRWLGDEGERDR